VARVKRPDWAVCRNYGQIHNLNGTGGSVTSQLELVTATEIAFYEDRYRIKAIKGQVIVVAPATSGVYSLHQRLRLALEDQETGTIYNHGTSLNDGAVAEEGFLNEKIFTIIGASSYNPSYSNIRNSTVGTHPWYSVWDQQISRTLEPGEALVLSTQWALSTDMVTIQIYPFLRFLVETW